MSNSGRPGRSGEASGILPRRRCPAALATGSDPVDYDLRAVMLGEGE